jgi:hypothetical protein
MIINKRYLGLGLFILLSLFVAILFKQQLAQENQIITADPCLDKYNQCEVSCYYKNVNQEQNYLLCNKKCTEQFRLCIPPNSTSGF